MTQRKRGGGKKLWKRPEANARKRLSFQKRYGMTRTEWLVLKKRLRKEGRGVEIARLYENARA